ncbi:MAG: Fic family protein, partial [Salinisphaera sp.]|nr:Fic family protein [Salinisphaera sp.]
MRRWLAEWADQGRVIKTGRKRGTRYQLSPPFPAPVLAATQVRDEPESAFERSTLPALEYVRQPLFKRKPVSYNRAWFEAYRPNQSGYFTPDDLAALAAQGQRSTGQEPAGTYARRIYNRLLIDLSYNSSRLEGNTYSLLDTQKLVLEGAGAEGKLDEERIMILNHKEAIRHLVDSAPRLEVSYNELCTLHYLLSDGLVPPAYSGKVRDHGVRIGASSYIPLESPAALDRQLRAIATKAAAIENPYEQSLFALMHVAYLQAFTDVNKRTSRLAANISLVKNNLVPLSFNSIGQDDYASAMIAIYELNDPRPLIRLY